MLNYLESPLWSSECLGCNATGLIRKSAGTPEYPWGGLYGGQIFGQALRAAAATVPNELSPHSLRAYFIRRGDDHDPVRYEVDRISDGRSFATRR